MRFQKEVEVMMTIEMTHAIMTHVRVQECGAKQYTQSNEGSRRGYKLYNKARVMFLPLINNIKLNTMTKKEQLGELYKKYGLLGEDTFKSPQGWVIITRSGIDKIQANAGIDIDYEVIEYTPGVSASIKGTGVMLSDKEITVQSFGSAIVGGYGKGTTKSLYTLEMAEKRAMSRVVLKLSGFYALGAFGEDESEDFKKTEKQQITSRAISKANDMVLRGEKTAEEMIDVLEESYEVGESIKFNLKQLKSQK